MTEQWTGDWMRDAETGQLIDGPAMNRYQMFMLIRELRAVIRAHAQTIRDKQAVIDAATERKPSSDLSKQLIASIPITHMSRLQWIQFKDAVERLHNLEDALQEFSRQNCEVGLQAMREKHADLLVDACLAHEQPQRKRLNNGQCAAQIVDCDCRWCSPEAKP